MNTRLYFVRHAEAEGNIKRIFHGWTDSSITENGHVQAQRIAQRLLREEIDLIYSSPLIRTMETAGYISASKGIDIFQHHGLKEINGGEWENVSFEELQVRWPKLCYTWDVEPHNHVMPKGESMVNFGQRVFSTVNEIVEQNPGKNICIVTHGTVIKTLMCYFNNKGLRDMINIRWYENTALSIIEINDGGYEVLLAGDDSHLSDDIATLRKQDWHELLEEKIKQFK
jgi:probable phosphoglycerate mutase